MKANCCQCPTASSKRWGSFILIAGLLSVLAGCAGTPAIVCGDLGGTAFSADEDSLGLDEFLALNDAQRESRHRQARRHLAEANKAHSAVRRIQALNNAAGVAPDDPDIWLLLADIWRGLGNYLATDASLSNAAAAIREFDGDSWLEAERGFDYGDRAALETALQRAWLHYDRGEWREAMPWVRAALKVEPGSSAVLRVRGLLEGIQGKRGMAHQLAEDLRRKDAFTTDISWVMFNLDTAMGRHREAFNYCYTLRPDQRRAAECYRDMARAAERVSEWSWARRWYRESAAALPHREISCLSEVSYTRVSDPDGDSTLPFWLAFDEHYVTGSLSAYLAFAYAQFEAATNTTDQERWGGLVVNAAGICLRLEMEEAHVRRVRGLVFARTNRNERAVTDLEVALEGLRHDKKMVAELEAEIGHLLLIQEKHDEAIGRLRHSVTGEPDKAQAWSDLGLALIMAGDEEEAVEALTRAIALDKGLAAAWYNRGLMHFHAGNLTAAKADLAEAARLAPDNPDVARLLQQVVQQQKRQ